LTGLASRLNPNTTLVYSGSAGIALAVGALTAVGLAGAMVGVLLVAIAFWVAYRRTEWFIAGWLLCLYLAGRSLTRTPIGPVYATELALAISLLGVAALVLRTKRLPRGSVPIFLTTVGLVLAAIPALVVATDQADSNWPRNTAIVYYVLIAVVALAAPPERRTYELLFAVTLAGSLGAVALVTLGFTGGYNAFTTSTGAVRIAHGSFAVPFAFGLIALLAALREQLIPRRVGLLVVPLIGALISINHRSAWLAFLGALIPLFFVRSHSALRTVAVVASAVTLIAVAGVVKGTSVLDAELARAQSITNTDDPNAAYRLKYWRNLLGVSARKPIEPSGFGTYPASLTPRDVSVYGVSDPHNSFVALAYRLGLLPAVLVLGLSIVVFGRAALSALRAREPWERAALSSLSAAGIFMLVFASLNVVLETPYLAPYYWITLGLAASLTARVRAESGLLA
jgi:hypothetical protein